MFSLCLKQINSCPKTNTFSRDTLHFILKIYLRVHRYSFKCNILKEMWTIISSLLLSAEDDNEISFDVDEIITDIEQIDDGWWRGTRQLDGSNGLFPSNYVELI